MFLFLECRSVVIRTLLSTIGVAMIFVSKNTNSSWLYSIVNFILSFNMFLFIHLVFSVSVSLLVGKNTEKHLCTISNLQLHSLHSP